MNNNSDSVIDRRSQYSPSILILNQYFYPDQSALSQMMTDLANGMKDRGYSVTVLCSRNTMIPETHSKGKLSGISVIRVLGTRFGKALNLGRLIDYLTFLLFAFLRLPFIPKHDIVFVTTAPPMLGVLGMFVRRLYRSLFVYNIQDLYPHTAIQAGVISNRAIIRLLHLVLRRIVRAADIVVPIGGDMAKRVSQELPIKQLTVIQNWANGDVIFPVSSDTNHLHRERRLSGSFLLMYSGNFGIAHEFDTILQAAALLKHDPRVSFLFVGDGVGKDRILQAIREGNLANVHVQPFQPNKELASSLSACDVAIVTLARGMEGLIVPSKVYSAMAAGRAIVYIGNPSSTVAELITAAACGIVVPNGDANGLVKAVHRLRNDETLLAEMQTNARRYFNAHLDFPIAMEKYDALFRQALIRKDHRNN